MNKLKNIDRFYYLLAVVGLLSVVLVIIVARGIIGALNKATYLDEELLQPQTLHINKADLDSAYTKAQEGNFTNLDL